MVAQKVGVLFPGQGAQYVGMGKDGAAQCESIRRIYDEADRISGLPLSRLCFEGPEETLARTLYAQPAIFVTSLALFRFLEEKLDGLKPDFVAGLSLGEFTALTATGSLSFSDGLRLVKLRAEFMEKSAQQHPGIMASVIGLTQPQCEEIARETGASLANLNAPDQFVLSGSVTAVEKAASLAEAGGARRVMRLKVGGAFHSPLMESARKDLEEALKNVRIQGPRCHFVANASAQEEKDPERIRRLLGEQVTKPVRWIETMWRARALGVQRFIETGPGRVLKGLAKRIDPTLEVHSFEKLDDLDGIASLFEKV